MWLNAHLVITSPVRFARSRSNREISISTFLLPFQGLAPISWCEFGSADPVVVKDPDMVQCLPSSPKTFTREPDSAAQRMISRDFADHLISMNPDSGAEPGPAI
jgi:hypothetical protein